MILYYSVVNLDPLSGQFGALWGHFGVLWVHFEVTLAQVGRKLAQLGSVMCICAGLVGPKSGNVDFS